MSEAGEEDEPTTTDGGDHTAGDSTDFGDRTEDDGSGNPAAKKKKKERKDRKPTVHANTNTKITKVSESEDAMPLKRLDKLAVMRIEVQKWPSYKNLLQEWAHKNNKQLPVYHPELEGKVHQPQFRSTVEVGGEWFRSQHSHSRRKDAEKDAARVAYVDLAVKIIDDDDDTNFLGLIEQDVIFCKSILSDFAAKTKATLPTYSLDCVEGLEHMPLFVSSVSFDGNIYTGEAARKKKDAEQRAARSAVISILATKNPCMQQILRSKKHQIIAITSARINKERVVGIRYRHLWW
ncbi:hypothetical protein ACQ4PT_002933 [Festuca glaucescens]